MMQDHIADVENCMVWLGVQPPGVYCEYAYFIAL